MALVNHALIPWDFALILLFLGVGVPWLGVVRMKRLLHKSQVTSADRFALYGSTVALQWLLAALVTVVILCTTLTPRELAISWGNRQQVASVAAVLTLLLCLSQVAAFRRMALLPQAQRGSLFAIAEKIMPRTPAELLAYAGLACTAGLVEEFLYRGFVYAVFARLFAQTPFPAAAPVSLSALWFSVAHSYQGRRGVITTFILGIIFGVARLWTGSLLAVVVAHAGVDLLAGLYMFRILRRAQ